MQNNKIRFFSFLALAALSFAGLSLSACSNAKDKLGLSKKPPDEFAVVKNAPLSMPPNYTLRPPAPGAPRPQEQSPQEAARQSVFGMNDPQQGDEAAPASGTDSAFLNRAGATKTDPGIRHKIDTETTIINKKEQPVVKRLLGMDSPEQAPAEVVNAKEEAERLKKNKDQGQPVTAGKTPSLER